ncbi:MAG TPA: 23S rRNA (adenine(2030)-N(6))-methyltransferase RlmJ [Xanthobacteraceae bacterium]
MNYQHAFHAGNFADVHKHIVLTRILDYLRQKPAAFRVIDTHAGAGLYNLLGPQAARSGEWRDGIGRLFAMPRSGAAGTDSMEVLVAPYLDIIAALNPGGTLRLYPGSPLIVKALLRTQDRLIACELEPTAAALLKAALYGDARAKVLSIDGWVGLFANIPPKERRGLIVIDPPYEETVEFARLSDALAQAYRKWPNGLYLLWYPIKYTEITGDFPRFSQIPPDGYRDRQQKRPSGREGADALARQLRRTGIPKLLRCELSIGPARAEGGLTGSGLIVVNPPFPLERELRVLLPAVVRWLAPTGGTYRLDWLSGE